MKEGKDFCWVSIRRPSMIFKSSGKDGGRTEGPEAVRVEGDRVPLHASNICVHCAFFTSGLAMSFKWTVKLWVGICA